MLKLFLKAKKNKKGFTLTELIVVVAILGVLAAIATPMILNSVGTARTNADNATLKTIQNVVDRLVAAGTVTVNASGAIDTTGINLKDLIEAQVSGGDINAPSAGGHFAVKPSTRTVSIEPASATFGADLIRLDD